MAYTGTRSVNADSDDESSSSATTLGQQSHSSVGLLLGLSNRTSKPKSQQRDPAHANGSPLPPLRNGATARSRPVINPAFASPFASMQQRLKDSTSGSASTTISPSTQTLNELSQLSATASLAAATGDDLMYDMSQLSQLPLHHEHDNPYAYGINNAKEPEYYRPKCGHSPTAHETARVSVSGSHCASLCLFGIPRVLGLSVLLIWIYIITVCR